MLEMVYLKVTGSLVDLIFWGSLGETSQKDG